jgi:hypothetical protein
MAAGQHEWRYEMTEVLDDACRECLRRSWLLSELSKLLDYNR